MKATVIDNPLTILESPYAGDVESNVNYARAAMRDSLLRGEKPLASHLLYTQEGILDDDIPAERTLGIEAGLQWGELANLTVLYLDKGISRGMQYGIARALRSNRPIILRFLDSSYRTESGHTLFEKYHCISGKVLDKQEPSHAEFLEEFSSDTHS